MARDFYQSIIAMRNEDGLLVPLSGVEITVKNIDTSPATIYQGRTGASQGPSATAGATNGPNPFITGPSGAVEFWAEGPAEYLIEIEDTQGPPRIAARTDGWNAWPAADDVVTLDKIHPDVISGFDAEYLHQGAEAVFYLGHSFLISGEQIVPAGGVGNIPKLFIPEATPFQSVRLMGAMYSLVSGNCTFSIQVNDSPVAGLSNLAASVTDNTNLASSPVSISHTDDVRAVILTVSNTPMDLSITLYFEHTVLIS